MKKQLIEILKDINPYECFDDKTDLIEEGVLDSLGIMVLIGQIEEKMNVSIDLDKIEIEDFINIDAIISMIKKVGEN